MAPRTQRVLPVNAKQAALQKFAELKKGGIKRSDQFEVPRAVPLMLRKPDSDMEHAGGG